MTSNVSGDPRSASWEEVEQRLAELADLAASGAAADPFHAQLLDAVVQLLAAEGGACWLFDEAGQLLPRHQANWQALHLSDSRANARHDDLLVACLHRRQAMAIPADAPLDADLAQAGTSLANPTGHLLAFCPIMVEEIPVGVVEVFLQREPNLAGQRGMLQLLGAVAELAADYHRTRQLRELRESSRDLDGLARFVDRIHGSLEPEAVDYALANETRWLLGCDRVTVLRQQRRGQRVTAVSGADQIHTRSEGVTALEHLANVATHTGEPIYYGGDSSVAPELLPLFEAYIDSTHAHRVAVLPLAAAELEQLSDDSVGDSVHSVHSSRRSYGTLILEQWEGDWPEGMRSKAAWVAPLAASAQRNSEEIGALPLLFLSRWLRSVGWLFGPRGRPRAALVLLTLAAALACLLLIPAPLRVRARGQTQPQRRARIYAPHDADVQSVSATDGQRVKRGAPLLTLRSLALEAERDQAESKLQTAQARMDVIDIEMVTETDAEDKTGRQSRLAAERRELELLCKLHQQRVSEVKDQLRELQMTSPIDGEVLSWMVRSELSD
ncbi:MAG: efflux RND transporter periplasmic adaptor subunit, partial [Planctomycetales bacterium]|nr:efflux RND transporter periplasmic adaptor subunit [Planctomycetales bacterium]